MLDASKFTIDGVRGEGDSFMVGDTGSVRLTSAVEESVASVARHLHAVIGPVKIEWVFDGRFAWVVQLSPLGKASDARIGDDAGVEWEEFRFQKGRLEEFRNRVLALRGSNKGILVIGNVSPLSHVGEIAEQYGVPTRFLGANE
jgi:hypothetical protein